MPNSTCFLASSRTSAKAAVAEIVTRNTAAKDQVRMKVANYSHSLAGGARALQVNGLRLSNRPIRGVRPTVEQAVYQRVADGSPQKPPFSPDVLARAFGMRHRCVVNWMQRCL